MFKSLPQLSLIPSHCLYEVGSSEGMCYTEKTCVLPPYWTLKSLVLVFGIGVMKSESGAASPGRTAAVGMAWAAVYIELPLYSIY